MAVPYLETSKPCAANQKISQKFSDIATETFMLQVRKVDSVEVANYLMERMGKGSATAELIHPDELVAGVISQVAAEPDMGDLLAAFVYSSDGERNSRQPAF